MTTEKKSASLLDAIIPIAALMIMLFTSVRFYGSNSSYGANQIALILGAAIATLIGFKNGYSWKEIEQGISKGISTAYGAILILMMVGSLIGSWIISGTVPTMIYYGLQLLEPSIFYVAACLICAMVSISIGSSWTTAGTVGVALIGIASGLEMSLAITAGAIISGAYFGDKMSPLSDTTNLAPAVAGTDLFTHIKHMIWTTGPSIIIALILFTIIGFVQDTGERAANLGATVDVLQSEFNITLWALIPLFLVLFMAFKKVPAFLTLLVGALSGCLFAIILQPQVLDRSVVDYKYECRIELSKQGYNHCEIESITTNDSLNNNQQTYLSLKVRSKELDEKIYSLPISNKHQSEALVVGENETKINLSFIAHSNLRNTTNAIWRAMFEGYQSNSGNAAVDKLLSRGGMWNMMNTIWLILTALTFGAVLETIGLLQRIVASILSLVKGTGSLIGAVIGTCITTNIIAADQYIAIVLPGRMYKAEFKRRGLDPRNLSRTLEDSATITSPLIPWNTCGVYMFGVLGVPTLSYLPFCFFNLINPLIAIFYGIANIKITPLETESQPQLEG
ncbi:MAG: Na+/H+ antiporter NhaC family protein [Enterobacterales bacterium]|nr:Na+/H+ antiporter NhaC family protein [Enterobacterales bacterium]